MRRSTAAHYALPTGLLAKPLRAQAAHDTRERAMANRENVPTPVPTRARYRALHRGSPVYVQSGEVYEALPTDPVTGAMVEPDLPLHKYVTETPPRRFG